MFVVIFFFVLGPLNMKLEVSTGNPHMLKFMICDVIAVP